MTEESATETPLAEELRKLAQRGIQRAFQWVGDTAPLEAPTLFGIVEYMDRERWNGTEQQRINAIENVIRLAAEALINKPLFEGSHVRHSDAVLILYDLSEIDPELEGKHFKSKRYSTLVAVLKAQARLTTFSHFDRFTKETRGFLAEALKQMSTEESSSDEFPTDSMHIARKQIRADDNDTDPNVKLPVARLGQWHEDDIPYVRRDDYHVAFDEHLSKGERLIAFVGEPGNGKSRLAREVTNQKLNETGGTAVLVRRDQMQSDLAGALARAGIRTYDMSGDGLKRAFAAYICSADAPQFVILDNVEDRESLAALAPPMARSLVVVTSRENQMPPGGPMPIVVSEMTKDEAASLIRHFLPNSPDEQAAMLSQTLGARPLAIVHTCAGLLVDGFMTVEQFCAEFDRNAGRIMKRTRSPEDAASTLTWIYEQILARLRQLDQKAEGHTVSLLELVAFVGPEGIPAPLLHTAFRFYVSSDDENDALSAFQAAQRDLCARYLVARTDGISPEDRAFWSRELSAPEFREFYQERRRQVARTVTLSARFSVHPLTQAMLRSILTRDGRERELCLHLHEGIRRQLAGETGDDFSAPVSDETAQWLPHAFNAARGLVGCDDSLYAEIDFGQTLAVVIRGFLHVGDATKAQRAAALYAGLSDASQWERTPHMEEAYVEDLKLRYSLGDVPHDQYAKLLFQIQMRRRPESNTEGKKQAPRPSRFLEIIEAFANDASYEVALDFSLLFDELYSRQMLSSAILLRRAILLGEIYHAQGRWEDSEQALREAYKIRQGAQRHGWSSMREDLRGLVTHVQNALHSNSHERVTLYEKLADTVWGFKPEDVTDYLSQARYSYIKARCAAVAVVRTYVAVVHGEKAEDANEVMAQVSRVQAYFGECMRSYAAAGWVRHAHELHADAVMILGLTGYALAERRYLLSFDECLRAGTWLARARLGLVIERGRLITRSLPRDTDVLTAGRYRTEAYADRVIGGRMESPYLYAEFLAISCVYDQMLGNPRPGKLEQVRATYESIGRLDRWHAVSASLDRLPHDADGYVREFAYLWLP